MSFIQELVSHSIPWAKPSYKANPWWTNEIQNLVHEERQLRRQWLSFEEEWATTWKLKVSRQKKKLIAYEKRKAF